MVWYGMVWGDSRGFRYQTPNISKCVVCGSKSVLREWEERENGEKYVWKQTWVTDGIPTNHNTTDRMLRGIEHYHFHDVLPGIMWCVRGVSRRNSAARERETNVIRCFVLVCDGWDLLVIWSENMYQDSTPQNYPSTIRDTWISYERHHHNSNVYLLTGVPMQQRMSYVGMTRVTPETSLVKVRFHVWYVIWLLKWPKNHN